MKELFKKRSLWITLGVILGIILVFVILCFTLFGLKTVKVDWRTSINKLAGQENEIVKSGEFAYNGSVLFMSKKKAKAKIEKANPYIKVVNIETTFPSTYVIHATERLEVYALQVNGKTLITDDEFKVLRIEDDEFVTGADKPILYTGLEFDEDKLETGEFLSPRNAIDIYSAFTECNRLLHEQKALISSVEVGTLFDENINKNQPFLRLKMNDGQTYLIKNCTYGLKYKVSKLLAVYSQIFTIVGEPIDKDDESKGKWTSELIKNSVIEINNYYREDLHTEKDCYFVVIPPQSASNV